MDESDDDVEWACLRRGHCSEAFSEAVSDEFSEYARASMLHDLGGVRVGRGGRGVKRATQGWGWGGRIGCSLG